MRYAIPLCLLLTLAATGCQRPPMALPAMFAAGQVDPLADVHESQRRHTQTLFFVTDRVYDEESKQYTRFRSDTMDLGVTVVGFGNDGDWPTLAAGARGEPGGKRFSPELESTVRLGSLSDRHAGIVNFESDEKSPPDSDKATPYFIEQLDEALDQSSGKVITVYLHGFKNGFKEAALTAAEYDFYTGGLGPFILYSWPSYNSIWEYSHDRDSVRYTTAHARRFVEFLADEINAGRLGAEKIHFIAHSSGAEVVGSVLRELALMSRDLPPEERQKKWRIGSVLLIAPDISTDVARERVLKEDLRGMYDEVVVYSSVHDRALNWAARVLYRTPRIGSIHEEDLTEADRYWLTRAKNVALVDSDSAPYDGFINHSHHRFSPAVSSDIILCLRSGLPPEQRGLVRGEGQAIWRFAEDHAQRVTAAAIKAYPIQKPQ